MVKEMFGSLADDEEVTAIDRRAREAMAKAGAEIVDVVIHGVDDQMRLSSLIDAEFKFDLVQYLSRWPNAPVHSLQGDPRRAADYADRRSSANFKRRDARHRRPTRRTSRRRGPGARSCSDAGDRA